VHEDLAKFRGGQLDWYGLTLESNGSKHMKPCSYCGRENSDGTLHCVECGTQLEAPQSPSEPATEVPTDTLKPAPTSFFAHKKVLLGAALVLVCAALYFALDSLDRPQLDSAKAVRIADAVLVNAGFSLNDYANTKAQLELADKRRSWKVIYERKVPSYSDAKRTSVQNAPRALMVTVDDDSSRTQLAVSKDTVGGGTLRLPSNLKSDGSPTQNVDGRLTKE
jgi:hypothetical protein